MTDEDNYAEKRDFYRMVVDCPIRYRKRGQEKSEAGLVKDLSASGLSFECVEELRSGEVLEVVIKPVNDVTPPFAAVVSVIRCIRLDESSAALTAACGIDHIIEAYD
ncbi:MAG: PilZ domain-containing protein [Gammaproteobacteria bacterium]|nr:PilZ domain-containing protein [Gammaproteobacteria bacterium]